MKYAVMYGNGTAWYSKEIVEVDRPTTDYGAILDMAIDQIEEREGKASALWDLEDIESAGYNEDEYVVGGNHGLALLHFGNFEIREYEGEVEE